MKLRAAVFLALLAIVLCSFALTSQADSVSVEASEPSGMLHPVFLHAV